MRLSQVLEVQLLGQFHDAGRGSDVKRAGALALRLERVPYLSVGERLGFHRYDAAKKPGITVGYRLPDYGVKGYGDSLLGVFPLVFRYLRLVRLHVKLRRSLAAHDRQPFLGRGLETPLVHPAVLIFCLDVQHVLHVQLKRIGAARPHHARPLVDLEPSAGCMKRTQMVSVRPEPANWAALPVAVSDENIFVYTTISYSLKPVTPNVGAATSLWAFSILRGSFTQWGAS